MKKPQHWQAIYGSFSFKPDEVIFHGEPVTVAGAANPIGSVGLAMSDAVYAGGTIVARIGYEKAKSIPSVQIVLARNPLDNSILTAGIEGGYAVGALAGASPGTSGYSGYSGNSGDVAGVKKKARFVITIWEPSVAARGGQGYRVPATTAFVDHPETHEMQLKTFQSGSLMELYADDVHVLRHILDFSPAVSQCGLFCQSMSDVAIRSFEIDARARSAFVIMQFSPPFEHLFNEVIRPVADECGVRAEKADDIMGPGMVISDITRRLQEADIVIADTTPQNANVFYELGYAHAIGKPTILLAEKGRELPFDISGYRTLFYENSIAGKSQIETGLRKHLRAIIRERGF